MVDCEGAASQNGSPNKRLTLFVKVSGTHNNVKKADLGVKKHGAIALVVCRSTKRVGHAFEKDKYNKVRGMSVWSR